MGAWLSAAFFLFSFRFFPPLLSRHEDAQSVVTGIVGCAGLYPTCAAIEAGKDICLANKETLIAGGPHVLPLIKKHNVRMLPADSEHSAIFQCIQVGKGTWQW